MENKLKDLIYYLSSKISTLSTQYQSKKKLVKLLYLIDFYSYRDRGTVIGTDEYIAQKMGPVPKGFFTTVDEMVSKEIIEVKQETLKNKRGVPYRYDTFKILKPMSTKLDAQESEFADKFFNKYKLKNGKYMEELTHSQAPWNSVDLNEPIPIVTAYLLPEFKDLPN